MHVTLLGPVSLEAGGLRLALGGRKQRAVFALLALSANRPVSLDRLVYEIWRDEPPARATVALQAYISRLRRLLTDTGEPTKILTRAPGWVLEIPARQIDVFRFDEMVSEARAWMSAGAVDEAADRLRSALGLWSGQPLADLDDRVATEDVARLQESRLEAAELMFEADLACGADSDVIKAARVFVDEHPFRERAWCALIAALYRSGRQADALRAVRDLREKLAEGLGLDPSPDAQRLEAMILRHDPELLLAPAPTRLARAAPDVRRSTPTVDGLVVGRRGELDRIVTAVRAAHRGAGRLMIVDGPAGMGKSTLLQRLAASVAAVDGITLRATGIGTGAMPALWPWVTIVRALATQRPDLVHTILDGPAGQPLALLDPSLGCGPEPLQAESSLARTHLYRAVIDLLTATREQGPLAVILDDAHWLDAETLDLLSLAVDALLPVGVLFAVALRPDEPGSEGASTMLASLGSRFSDAVVRLPLTGLDTDDVGTMIAGINGEDAEPGIAAAIRTRTGGNPFFVVELVQLLVSERRLDAAGVNDVLPDGIRDVLRRRLDRLPDQTLALLSIVALLGRPTPVELLTRISGSSENAVLDGCEAAMLSGLLVEDSGGDFGLSHDLVRQTLDEALSTARRVRLHARIGSALAPTNAGRATVSSERAVEVAHHLTRAAPVVGPLAAVPYLTAAADHALAQLAPDQADHFLAVASGLVDQIPDRAQRVTRLAELDARRAVGQLIVRGSGVSDTRQIPAPDVVGAFDPAEPTAWWSATALLIAGGHNARALEAAELAMRDDLPAPASAVLHFMLGLASFELGQNERCELHFARTEQLLASDGGDSPGEATFSFAGSATVLQGCSATVRGADAQAKALLAAASGMPGLSLMQSVTIEFWSAWAAAQRGDARVAAELATTCIARAEGLGETFYVPGCEVIIGWSAAVQGDPLGLDDAQAAFERYVAMGLLHQVTTNLVLRAEAHAHYGQLDIARTLIAESRAVAARTGEATLNPRLCELAGKLEPAH